ncbi:MAG: Na+/H+ antiporter [uncultured Solirubrobacteraceae bacterium]|uniref:Na+/H+ antiporter n=1 Tax=uncultured Solirubrobacteraceae bacterium TaxID=1162706 RepID=A0A6J4RN32_9ACTN|nr:MAG: Na+/H+ antiporter [uncultured Solirubrobacteraceae bacterium]
MSLPEWLLAASVLLAAAVILGVLAQRAHIQLTVVLVVVGFLAGWAGEPLGFEAPLRGERFEQVVVYLFLPVLVFEAALGLSVRAFFRNLGPILLLAVVALLVSTVLVGGALTLALGIPVAAALLFGALISATDPVAVVAVFRELGVSERLLTIVEGESLFNDGVAIVLFGILLEAALGSKVSIGSGVADFVLVFFGGAAVGVALAMVAALLLPWIDRLLATGLSVGLAYGSFVVAEHVLGLSGVLAAVAAGLTLAGFAPSRASAEARLSLTEFWEGLGFVANALLFLLIGLAIEPGLLAEQAGAIALAVAVVLIARALAVVPLVSALDRFGKVGRVGRRNEAVLIWGGLRGGVALALALALPESLEQRDQFVAMTGGVVLATLLLNATTIAWLIHRLGLDEVSRPDRFLASVARLRGAGAARRALDDLSVDDDGVLERLDASERRAREELERIELTDEEQRDVVTRQGLHVERQTYQRLSDLGMLPPTTTRALLHEVDDLIEESGSTRFTPEARHREPPRAERLATRISAMLPEPAGEDPGDLAYSEAMARCLAARHAVDALELFEDVPNVDAASIEGARSSFAEMETEAEEALEDATGDETHARAANALSRVAAADALEQLSDAGLLPAAVARKAWEDLAHSADGAGR